MNYRQKIQQIIEHKFFQNFILCVIIFNAAIMGVGVEYPNLHNITNCLDEICIVIFVVEIVLRIFVYRLDFVKSAWNIFDFIIVAVCLLPSNSVFSATRLFRTVRVLRLVTVIPKMRLVSLSLVRAIPAMVGIGVLLIIVFYIYAIITTELYAKDFPQWFGGLGESLYSLFQIMTFESWSMGIVRPVMEVHPNAWVVFVSFILIAGYIILNLAIAVIIDSVNEIKETESEERSDADKEEILAHIAQLNTEIADLKSMLKKQLNQ